MWNEIPRVFFLPSPTSMYAARLAARWEKLSHSKFLLSPNAQCGKMHEKVAFCMHAPYDLTWPLHFRCFFSVFVLELLRQLPACLPACLPAYRGVSSLGMPGCHSPPLSTRGPHYAQLIATGTPGFSDLQTSLLHALQTVHHIFQPIQDFLDF